MALPLPLRHTLWNPEVCVHTNKEKLGGGIDGEGSACPSPLQAQVFGETCFRKDRGSLAFGHCVAKERTQLQMP